MHFWCEKSQLLMAGSVVFHQKCSNLQSIVLAFFPLHYALCSTIQVNHSLHNNSVPSLFISYLQQDQAVASSHLSLGTVQQGTTWVFL